jgi:hypothetical protein
MSREEEDGAATLWEKKAVTPCEEEGGRLEEEEGGGLGWGKGATCRTRRGAGGCSGGVWS